MGAALGLLIMIYAALICAMPAAAFFKKFPLICGTYFFWAAFSLLNFPFLAVLAAPVSLGSPIFIDFYGAYWDFLVEPVSLSLLMVTCVALLYFLVARRFKWCAIQKTTLAFVGNTIFLIVFLCTAEWHKNELIATALTDKHPDCVVIGSFLSSIRKGGLDKGSYPSPHAFFVQDDKAYIWSYALLRFMSTPVTWECHDRL